MERGEEGKDCFGATGAKFGVAVGEVRGGMHGPDISRFHQFDSVMGAGGFVDNETEEAVERLPESIGDELKLGSDLAGCKLGQAGGGFVVVHVATILQVSHRASTFLIKFAF